MDRFVFVSTDKAVRPSSVMGASKRIGEMLVADAARRTGRAFVSVRFGNVLGSTGQRGADLPVAAGERGATDDHPPDMTRFFMTIPEAAWLILDAAALGQDGDLFVLDMGQPDPGHGSCLGPRPAVGTRPAAASRSRPSACGPGEKLHEELFYDAETCGADREREGAATAVVGAAAESPFATMSAVCWRSPPGNAIDGLRAAMLDYVGSA